MTSEQPWNLLYWPGFPGRGEFVRLIFEEAKVPYNDVCNSSPDGVSQLMKYVKGENDGFPIAAPPVITRGNITIAQTANICFYLARKYNLCPEDEAEAFEANQIALTIADVVLEAHDTHHPISNALYYEDQKAEAKVKAKNFRESRIPKFLGYFERVLKKNEKSKGEYLIGSSLSYVDLSMFHLLVGLEYSFPKAMKRVDKDIPLLVALKARIEKRPNIASYLASKRRQPFNDGIFRRYPELDDP